MDVVSVELEDVDTTYGWHPVAEAGPFERRVLFPRHTEHNRLTLWRRVRDELDAVAPDVIAVPGWSTSFALAAHAWAVAGSLPSILLSASSETDAPRVWWREGMKSLIVRLHGAAVVGGRPQRAYAATLGLPENRIFEGYDVVEQ
jgi:hypothetical protein